MDKIIIGAIIGATAIALAVYIYSKNVIIFSF